MAGFANIKEYVDNMLGGAFHSCSFRKVPSQASLSGMFVDLSMAAGNPKPQYYSNSPFEAAVLDGLEGLFHGDNKSPEQMFITETHIVTPTAGLVGNYILCDYLLFYPFIELDNLDPQVMVNDVTLPRYTDGDGVRVMAVVNAPTAGSERFTFDYINQDGVAKTSPVQILSTASIGIASIPSMQPATGSVNAPFLALASGDTGVQQITGVTVTNAGGGLITLVLIKPLLNNTVYEINTSSELPAITMQSWMPQVYDGAYLNFIMQCSGSVAGGTVSGRINYVWG